LNKVTTLEHVNEHTYKYSMFIYTIVITYILVHSRYLFLEKTKENL